MSPTVGGSSKKSTFCLAGHGFFFQ
jgi:hypothetical protein